MRLAVAVEVLLLAACAVEWSLPQLAQVGVDVIVVVVGSGRDHQSFSIALSMPSETTQAYLLATEALWLNSFLFEQCGNIQ